MISIEFFLSERDQAITWRGPMLHKAIRQFLEDVDWGELDYLLIDLPPGTGDVSMTLAQLPPQARFVIVTTPQPAAQNVAKRAPRPRSASTSRSPAWWRTCPGSPHRAASASRFSGRRRPAPRRRAGRAAARQGPAAGGAEGLRGPRQPARARGPGSTGRSGAAARRPRLDRGHAPGPGGHAGAVRPPVPAVTGTALDGPPTRVARRAKALRADSGPVGRLRTPCL